ncbi:hypothetical protein ANO11243_055840 [Dothideomycetidae sp. 11243]|nr:hypothetical protein ANO11243_055840 [fungal sp. No.11243]
MPFFKNKVRSASTGTEENPSTEEKPTTDEQPAADEQPPRYTVSDASPPRSRVPQSVDLDHMPSHPDLADPYDSLFRVFQVHQLGYSTITVLDKALCLDFASFQSKARQNESGKGNVIFSHTRDAAEDFLLKSEMRKASDGHYLVYTSFRIWASDTTTLWERMRQYRRTETSHQPCPHIDFANHKYADVLCPSSVNCKDFSALVGEIDGWWVYCDRCATSCNAESFFEQGRMVLKLYCWHDLGTLQSPLASQWVRLATRIPNAVVKPTGSVSASKGLKARFDGAGTHGG